MVPDLSLYLMVSYSIWVQGVEPRVVFGEYYYSDAWQAVFAVDNSFILWGLLFGLALWRNWSLVVAFAGGALLHLALDFPLHTHDARMHFWPVSDWIFYGPFSYWDSSAHAGVIGPLEFVLSATCAFVLWQRFRSWIIRSLTLLFLAMEAMSSGIWRFFF